MKRKLLAALLALALLGTLVPAALAEEPAVTGPLDPETIPTVLDTGRGYVVYYALASAIYYSPDGAAWTDLSDRPWVQEARLYMGALSGQCRREFQILWTGEEYMMRQFLLDDPRTTHQVYGESPRNNKVTFLDEDFQIIGELDLGAPVEAIRREGETYYATAGGVEHAFTRQDWDRRFSDVSWESWFAKGVDLCSKKGVMVGVGDGRFDPERALTQAECLTLALRLYDLAHGQEPALLTAPEDWGRMTLTLADGTVFSGYGGEDGFGWWTWRNGYRGVYVEVPGWSDEDMAAGGEAQRAWMDAHPNVCGSNSPATLTLNGVTYPGTVNCWMPVGPYVLQFQPEDEAVNDLLHHAFYRETGPDHWWRDVCYTVAQRGLEEVFDPADFRDAAATRGFFAKALAAGCGEGLEQRFQVDAIPDLPREDDTHPQADAYREAVYALYEAGILNGVDDSGAFDAQGTLTRAQAAVMAARVLDEGQRIAAPPAGGRVCQDE